MTTPAVTVVAIGIERYGSDLFPDVPGPAYDACRFASLMQTLGVPRENILVALSPVDPAAIEQIRPGGYLPATRTGIGHLLTEELPQRAGDVVILYWAGHGYQDRSGGSQRLLVPHPPGLSSVTVDQVRAWLAGNRIAFDDQLLIVDACREEGNASSQLLLPLEFPPVPKARDRRQSILHAVAAGEEAPVITSEQTSVFSKALFAVLRELPGGQWPPDVKVIAERLATHDPRLAPVTVTYRDPRGNQDQVHLGAVGRTGCAGDHDESPVARVIKAFVQVPTMRETRNVRTVCDRIARKYGGAFYGGPPISNVVVELADMDRGWVVLRDVCVELPELFPPASNVVKELIATLDEVVRCP